MIFDVVYKLYKITNAFDAVPLVVLFLLMAGAATAAGIAISRLVEIPLIAVSRKFLAGFRSTTKTRFNARGRSLAARP